MPRIARVAPADTSLHDRIMRSLGPQVVEDESTDEPEPVEVEAAGGTAEGDGDEGVRVEDPELSSPAPAEPTNAEVRAWARDNDIEVADSGVIPKAVREAYDAAHAD